MGSLLRLKHPSVVLAAIAVLAGGLGPADAGPTAQAQPKGTFNQARHQLLPTAMCAPLGGVLDPLGGCWTRGASLAYGQAEARRCAEQGGKADPVHNGLCWYRVAEGAQKPPGTTTVVTRSSNQGKEESTCIPPDAKSVCQLAGATAVTPAFRWCFGTAPTFTCTNNLKVRKIAFGHDDSGSCAAFGGVWSASQQACWVPQPAGKSTAAVAVMPQGGIDATPCTMFGGTAGSRAPAGDVACWHRLP